MPGKVKRPVIVRVALGKKWTTAAKAKTTKKGTYKVSFAAPAKAGVEGRHHRAEDEGQGQAVQEVHHQDPDPHRHHAPHADSAADAHPDAHAAPDAGHHASACAGVSRCVCG
ncbi:hypothetical protein [Nocardioides daphniae]|uniref:hypothetical protein n=1 Tax=Nocardioides daphniae TaxID=402297 RepID=UPI0013153E83|nr:hypothetical protein [Nocardioides daphniae]